MLLSVWQWLVAPFQYEFMVKAVCVSALVGVVCAVLSCYVTLKGWSLMGDAISHAVVPGVVLSYMAGIPFAIGAFIFGYGTTVTIGFVKEKTRVKEDAVIGVIFTGFFAFGLVLISRARSNIDLFHILFGNVLGISNEDIIQTVIVSVITLAAVYIFRKDLLLFCFDPNHARSIGINTQFLYYMFLSLMSLTVVAALQAVGIILVVSMLVTPGAIAYLMSDRFNYMIGAAVSASVISCVLGTYISYYLDGATGGCIVVLLTILFFIAMVFAPRHGLLAQHRHTKVKPSSIN
ncbi:Mn2+ ABC transporter, permease protein [Calothrix sp. NIES-4071]|nr:Mn2+ ABC transporter, permease protein [Calothrix sp. NIES-4071]BAZ55335.1 Mn2+ ABC transporter, permease protein [Calothrix sp. NIES-4105]